MYNINVHFYLMYNVNCLVNFKFSTFKFLFRLMINILKTKNYTIHITYNTLVRTNLADSVCLN